MPYKILGTIRRFVSGPGPAEGAPTSEHASFVVEVTGIDKETVKEIETKVARLLEGLDRGLAQHRQGLNAK